LTRDIYTNQIIIAPKYHDELLEEAKNSGRTVENIMAWRVERYTKLQREHHLMYEAMKKFRMFCMSATYSVPGIFFDDNDTCPVVIQDEVFDSDFFKELIEEVEKE
jgi:hypothetical protein